MVINSPKYILVTNQRDITSDFLVRELQKREIPFFRFNTETLPDFEAWSSGEGFFLRSENITINTSLIKAAYFRRPGLIQFEGSDQADSDAYRATEWTYLLRSLYLELGRKWLSHPNNILLAENKPGQLKQARELGFMVPEYVVSNSLNAVKELFSNHPVVAKPLSHNLLNEGDSERVIFTVDVPTIEEIKHGQLAMSPVIFQQKIEKKFDLRITVVGELAIATQINSQIDMNTKTDWRAGGDKILEHKLVALPPDIENKCIELVKKMNLRYGAIDLVEDLNGHFWFLECNPNGQWAWIENMTGAPISKLIVDELISHGEGA